MQFWSLCCERLYSNILHHLKSSDFFDAATHPTLKFVGKKYEKGNDVDKLTGDLTIRNITKSITLDVENGGVAKDPWGKFKSWL